MPDGFGLNCYSFEIPGLVIFVIDVHVVVHQVGNKSRQGLLYSILWFLSKRPSIVVKVCEQIRKAANSTCHTGVVFLVFMVQLLTNDAVCGPSISREVSLDLHPNNEFSKI